MHHETRGRGLSGVLLCRFDYLVEDFSYNQVQIKQFFPPVKTSCPSAKNDNETLDY